MIHLLLFCCEENSRRENIFQFRGKTLDLTLCMTLSLTTAQTRKMFKF